MARKRILVLDSAEHDEPVGIILAPADQIEKLGEIEHRFFNENYDEDTDEERWETLDDMFKECYPKFQFVDFDGQVYI